MSKHLGSVSAVAMTALLAFCGAAAAAEWKVAKLGGHVVIKSGPMQGVSLTNGMVLQSGSVLAADASGRALLVHGGDQMIVSPNTMIAVPQDRGGVTAIVQSFGQTEFDVSHQQKPHFIVETPFLAAVVKGTHFTVKVLKRGASVSVARGRVEVDDLVTGERADVLLGQTALIQPGRHLAIVGPGIHAPILHGRSNLMPGDFGRTASLGAGGVTATGDSTGVTASTDAVASTLGASADTTDTGGGNKCGGSCGKGNGGNGTGNEGHGKGPGNGNGGGKGNGNGKH